MPTDDEKNKVTDISNRRLEDRTDSVMSLADALCKIVASFAPHISPEEQLLGIELCARATVEVMRGAFGEEELNTILVEVNRRSHQYTVDWNRKHADEIPAVEAGHIGREKAEVVPLKRPTSSEETDDGRKP